MDYILEKIKKGQLQNLTDHLNMVDETNSIKSTHEKESEGKIPFLDTLIVRKPDGSVKLLVYRKSTHTDQYLNFHSHHPIYHKLGVVRTLMDRCESLVTEDQDKVNEEKHIQQALTKCGYPKWTIDKVKRSMKKKKTKTTKRDTNKEKSRGLVVIPYVQGVSESIERSFRKHKVAVSVKPHRT